jgi:hypothetical protein|tara:strand:+ start:56 stop:229 length:174 start_codon:yes stop_codon:yes gene_type:complete
MITIEMKNSLKNLIYIWAQNYAMQEGIDPMPNVSDLGGYLQVSFSPVVSDTYRREEE